jgi:hypothetical protein
LDERTLVGVFPRNSIALPAGKKNASDLAARLKMGMRHRPSRLRGAFDIERELNVSARRMAVWTDLFVRLFDQSEGLILRQRGCLTVLGILMERNRSLTVAAQ